MGFLSKMRELLIQIDLFGKPVNLLVKKDQLYHTKVSLFLSLGVIVLSFVFFVYLLLDVIQLKNPNVTTKVEYVKNPELFTLTKDNFRFSAFVTSNEVIPLDNTKNRLYTLYIQQCDLQTSNLAGKKCQKIKMVSCSQVAKNALYDELQITQDMDKFSYCIPDEYWANDTLRLQGGLLSKDVKTFQFMLRYCDKYCILPLQKQLLKVEEECASPEEIQQQLQSGLIVVSFVNYYKDDSNPTTPYSAVNKQIITTFARDQKKDSQVYFRHSVMNTITNLFYFQENRQVDHVLEFDRALESARNIKDDYDYYLYVASFFLEEQKHIYTRTYDNILNLMGDIKGLSSFLMLVCGILIDPIQKTQMIAFLLHRIYSLKITSQPEKPITKLETKDNKAQIAQSGNDPLNDNTGSGKRLTSKVQPNFQQINNIIKINQQVSKKKISWREKFFYLVGITTSNLMSQGEKSLREQFDIVHIINKLYEIDKLKYLLLNRNQLQLFETLNRPEISCNTIEHPMSQHQDYLSFMIDNSNSDIKRQQQMQSFMILKLEPDILNKKLINMIDQDMKEKFDKEIELHSKNEQNKQDPGLALKKENDQNQQEGALQSKNPFLSPKDLLNQQPPYEESSKLIKLEKDQ